MILIDGNKISAEVKEEIALEVQQMLKQGKKVPHLAALIVGHDGGSETYVGHKEKACKQVGFDSTVLRFEDTVTEKEILTAVHEMNNNPAIDGFIIQLPLPKHISEQKVIEAIDPKKDVDGFHPVNLGRMVIGIPAYISATPAGIIELIKRYKIETSGKNVVVIGRSNIVGKPISILLSQKANPGDATVTLTHSRTKNLKDIVSKADIIIAALGNAEFLTADMVKEGAVVIDVGITRIKSEHTKSGWKLIGDVKFDEVSKKTSFITPVPGGVGPMTIVSLLQNTLKAAKGEIYPK
ncbi:MAG: bifunctional 5,10-methylene-tetrahydrofolate dehydrogenase/5,10-methylene-tetrahydrofolate cyclohydrolase [Bacteroidetes bacterium GWA2_31_9b]|nr:MAG: bifunctional 5,10-methylene-tetrahydrofolate dehydrogenase/5,10-methylene-tetrahydrofolate cyclohydrolase [Bacteroidetes bacterium GWA2_31_9b]